MSAMTMIKAMIMPNEIPINVTAANFSTTTK